MKNELVDLLHQSSTVADCRISELEVELQKYNKEKDLVKNKLVEALKEPGMKNWHYYEIIMPLLTSLDVIVLFIYMYTGRKEIIAEFKSLVSSFPEKMRSIEKQLDTHKVTASNIHCLRADVQSLTNIFDRKVRSDNLNPYF